MVVIFLLLTPAHSTLPTDESQMQTEVLQIQAHIISHAKIKMLYMYDVKGVQTFQ